MKKYILLVSAIAVAAVSCSKITPDTTANDMDVEINFDAKNYVNQTKASYSTSESFGCYAFYTGSTDWASATLSDAVKYIDNAEITYQTNAWKAKGQTYYWPKTGKLTFVCYSPKSANFEAGSSKEAILAKTGYTVTAAAASQKDSTENLMFADVANDLTKENATSVPVVFRHALAKIKFTAVAGSLSASGITYHIVVDTIKVSSIYNTGNVSFNGTNNTITWASQSGKANSGAIASTAKKSTNIVGATYATTDGELTTTAAAKGKDYYVLPQTLPADAKLTVIYTIYACNASGKILSVDTLTSDTTLNTIKNTSAITAWEKNKAYTYALTISPVSENPDDIITFSPSVEDWTDGGTGSVDIKPAA